MTPLPAQSGRTCPRRLARRAAQKRGGFVLVAALILLVVLAGFGAIMVRLSALEQAGSSLAVLGARAGWAARSGIDWALFEAQTSGGCPAASWTLGEGALAGFQVTVTCSSSDHREGSQLLRSLLIRSEAHLGPVSSPDHVHREVEATVVL